ncbi:MAG: lytic transglycosylase domain-containing protein [Beijerinckiaceae bacterium]
MAAPAAHAQQKADVTGSILPPPLRLAETQPYEDLTPLRRAAEAYRKGDIAGGDAVAAAMADPAQKIAAEWVAIRSAGRSLGFQRINAFMERAPDIPMQSWLQRRAEDALMVQRPRPQVTLAYFEKREPLGPNGRAILAAARQATGSTAEAEKLALAAYRDRALTRDVAQFIEATFPALITEKEKTLRAHRLVLLDQIAEGNRIAASVSADHGKLAQAIAYAADAGKSMSAIEAVPPALRSHPSFVKAHAQVLRRAGKTEEARDQMLKAPKAPEDISEAEEWWTERRMLARKLLDGGDAAGAYRIAAEAVGLSPNRRAEAEFHAGWIALRFLKFPQTAAIHFSASAAAAETPASRSRGHYWLGRALEAGAEGEPAEGYPAAARWSTTYYGQMAAEKLGRTQLEIAEVMADIADRAVLGVTLTGQVIDRLLAAELAEFAAPLAIDAARTANAEDIDALAARFVARNDAATVLAIGRTGMQRGLPVEHHAFPTFGIPSYDPLPGSGEKAMVYAIARQESAFQPKVVSTANARGLMQMLPSTAARTAKNFKVPFEPSRLTEDPALNARLGAAHLGELLVETKGSLIMTFASYNAGGHRVREWIAAYGDPRSPDVDPIDWVERIPFSETRNYVQRVMENLQVYRARLSGGRTALVIGKDMERGRR